MNIIEIPFVDKIGIQRNADGELELPFYTGVQNHLETIRASAQSSLKGLVSNPFTIYLLGINVERLRAPYAL
jgi:hypothetical protein